MKIDDPRERYVLLRYKIEGYSACEVAAAIASTEGNVYTLCSRAIGKLRKLLDADGGNADE